MPRQLSSDLDAIQTSITGRRPAFKVEVFDVRSTTDTINDVVRGLTLNATTGPRVFTADVVSITIEEVASDFIDLGLVPTTLSIRVVDPNSQLDPFLNPAPAEGRWLRRGNVVRIFEGDDRVPEADWANTFTGELQGQAGVTVDRNDPPGSRILTMNASDRMAGFLKYPSISNDFLTGTTYRVMMDDIAASDMALDPDEVDFLAVLGTSEAPWPVQFVDEPPMVSLARLMQPEGFIPKFTGDGKLTQTQALLLASADRTYFDNDMFVSAVRPFSDISPTNSVQVIGLDGVMSEVEQPRQALAELSVTTGFFTQDERVEVFWSEDKTLLAKSVNPKTVRSVNGGLTRLGAGEKFFAIPSPNNQAGSIGFAVEFKTGFAPWLIIILLVIYLVLVWIPDEVLTFGLGASGGFTINVGSAIAAISLSAALIIMTMIGRGIYRFEGVPYEFVFKEIKAIAEIDGTLPHDRIRIEVENHLITSQAVADTIAMDVLFLEQAKGNVRMFSMHHDLRLEPNDVFQTETLQLFLIQKISRTLQRGVPTIATLECFESTQAITP